MEIYSMGSTFTLDKITELMSRGAQVRFPLTEDGVEKPVSIPQSDLVLFPVWYDIYFTRIAEWNDAVGVFLSQVSKRHYQQLVKMRKKSWISRIKSELERFGLPNQGAPDFYYIQRPGLEPPYKELISTITNIIGLLEEVAIAVENNSLGDNGPLPLYLGDGEDMYNQEGRKILSKQPNRIYYFVRGCVELADNQNKVDVETLKAYLISQNGNFPRFKIRKNRDAWDLALATFNEAIQRKVFISITKYMEMDKSTRKYVVWLL